MDVELPESVVQEFSKISDMDKTSEYLKSHTHVLLQQKGFDELLGQAFKAEMAGKSSRAKNCVQQALVIQYCMTLGRSGIGLFFKR